jgi:hypothetical protein
MARAHTESGVRILAQIAADADSGAHARIAAIALLFERGWGKAPQPHTGEDGEGAIKVLVRHIVNGKDVNGPLIEHKQHLPIGRSEEE